MAIRTIVEPQYEAECDRCHNVWPVTKDEQLPLVPFQMPLTYEAGSGDVYQICQECATDLTEFMATFMGRPEPVPDHVA